MAATSLRKPLLPASVVELLPLLAGKERLWLVGGAVRDQILKRPVVDLDFAVEGEARNLARRLANRLGADYFDLDVERDTGRVLWNSSGGRRSLDFSRLRGGSLQSDLAARDFTVNAMAVELAQPERVVDPSGGLQDLRDRVLRAVNPSSVYDDPVRTLRAVRLATELELRIEPATLSQVRQAGAQLARVAPERVRDELMRILGLARAPAAVRVMHSLGLLSRVLPELEPLKGLAQPSPHAFDALEHTLAVVDRLVEVLAVLGAIGDEDRAAELTLGELWLRLSRFRGPLGEYVGSSLSEGRTVRQLMLLGALYHDVGKAATQSADVKGRPHFYGHEIEGVRLIEARARSLRLSIDEEAFLATLVRNHMRPEQLASSGPVAPRAVYRFFRDAGEAGVGVVLLSLADLLGKRAGAPPQEEWSNRVETARLLLEAYFEARAQRVDPPRLVRGDELMRALHLAPGPEVGALLEALREAQAAGEVETPDQAIALAASMLESGEVRRGRAS